MTWKVRAGRKTLVGSRAGYVDVKGYVAVRVFGETMKAHRVAWFYMTGEWPVWQIDHIDRNKSNNAFSNLRDVTPRVNAFNKDLNPLNKSGVTGVYFKTSANRWKASITTDAGKKISRFFHNLEDARDWRLTQEGIHYGTRARPKYGSKAIVAYDTARGA